MPVNPPTGGDPGVAQRTRNGLQEDQISEHDYKHQLDILKVYEPESYNFARMEEIEEKRRGRIRLQKEAEELAVPTPKGCPRPPICGNYSKVDAAVVKEFETRLGVEKGPTTIRAWKNYLQRAAEVIAQY